MMGAIAVRKQDEAEIVALQKALKARSKAQVIRTALDTLRNHLQRENLRVELRESVRKCAEADRRENEEISIGAVARKS